MSKKLLSTFLALSMVFSMLPISVFAEEINTPIGENGEITAFMPLTETEKTVTIGTSIEDLELPENLTVTVRTDTSITEDNTVDDELTETTPNSNAQSNNETDVDIPVKWTCTPQYEMNTEGVYVFTPVINNYTISADLPQITVTVEKLTVVARGMQLLTELETTDNLITNPGGEVIDNGTLLVDNDWMGSNRFNSYQEDVEGILGAQEGNYYIALPAPNQASTNEALISCYQDITIPTTKTWESFNLTGYLLASGSGNNATLRIEQYDQYGTLLSASTKEKSVNANIWTKVDLTDNILPTAKSLRVIIEGQVLSVGLVAFDNLSLTLTEKEPPPSVAKNTTTNKEYTALSEAVDNVGNGETIQLLSDIALEDYLYICNGVNFTLDLNNKKLTKSNTSDNGTIIFNDNDGTMTITDNSVVGDGKITSTLNSDGTIYMSYGNLIISGGTVESIAENSPAIYNLAGPITISGKAKVSATTGSAIKNDSDSKITISDNAIVTSANTETNGGTILLNVGQEGNTVLEITGGTVENTSTTGNAIYNKANSKITIPSGTVIIRGGGMATNKAPDLSAYTNVQIDGNTTTSDDIYIVSEITPENLALEIGEYKYIKFYISSSTAPSITSQPSNQSVNAGGSAVFSVTASGDTPLAFQWELSTDGINWTDINGASNSSYTIDDITYEMNNYEYRCKVSNAGGSVTSNFANLTVNQLVSETPTADTTTIVKNSNTQPSVSFTLTNSPNYENNQIWKVYSTQNGNTLAEGVTATNTGNTLTLTHTLDIPATNYYVSVTQQYKKESARLHLTVEEYVAPVVEQFNLPLGSTYYFDLSSESANIGTINSGTDEIPSLPDTSMHYVPFTYVGTINAFSLEDSDNGKSLTEERLKSLISNRSLFVANHNASHMISWDALNANNLIFGKTFNTNYKLRSLSAGNGYIDANANLSYEVGEIVTPKTNEWDQILGKSGLTEPIKNWNPYSFGQDTNSSNNFFRTVRGYSDVAYYNGDIVTNLGTYNKGWRPALEVLNAGTLGSNGLKSVTLNLGDGSFDTNASQTGGVVDSINIVCAGNTFIAPSDEGLTSPTSDADTEFYWIGSDNNSYNVGDSVPNTVTSLTAQWEDVVTTYTISGTIKSSDTNSGIPATVQLKKDGSNVDNAVTANANGEYTISDIPDGTYSIEVSYAGYDSGTISSVVVSGSNVTGKDLTLTKTVIFKPVTDISMTNATSVQVNTDLLLAGTVTPNNATNKTIVWSVKNANGTGATITDSTFSATNAGTATIKATIINGLTTSSNYTKEFEITVTQLPILTHFITATAGIGGSITPSGSVVVNNGASQTFTITPNSNYSITDVKVDNVSKGKITTYTFNNVTETHTISATFSYNGGGGGSSSGGGSNSGSNSSNIVITTPIDKPNTPIQGEIKVESKVNGNGNVAVNITDKNINDAYKKALEDAKKNGNEKNGITLILNVETGNKAINTVSVNLPKTVQDAIISKKIVNTVVVVDNPDIKVGMDLNTITEINRQARADVNITATKADVTKLTDVAKTAIGNRPIFDLKVNYGSGKQVQNFGAGSISVEIPYTLSANEKAGNLYAVYVDTLGKVQWINNSVYDSVNKVLRFNTNHFSTYGIGYKQTNIIFNDIANHWSKENIEFVASRGLLNGTSANTFSPNTAITRGMFVTALGKLANVDISKFTKTSFNDVKNDAYYMPYIEWANNNNIINGVGNGKFAPDQSITREQMAVIMQNYAKTIGVIVPKVYEENAFADNTKIGSLAKEAVKSMQMSGIISVKDGNNFDPQGKATRAEVSAVLKRFVEIMINAYTTQGWVMNDSGKWMYYENGKSIIGNQIIGGVSYTFNQYGEIANTPSDLSYTTHTVTKGESWWGIAWKYKCSMFELARINNKTIFSVLYIGNILKIPNK